MIVRRVLWLLLWAPFVSHAQDIPATRNYLQGRDYYVLRSGNAQMIVQADQVDVGPAFTYLLFDAQWPAQSRKTANAFNFTPLNGTFSSAVGVKMKDFTFTPLAHTTTIRWIMENGIPSVEAVRRASGIKVREVITPAVLNGIFRRSMTLESADLVARDTATIKLSLHAPATWAKMRC